MAIVSTRILGLGIIILAAGGASVSTPLAHWEAEGAFTDSAGRHDLTANGPVGFRDGAIGQGFDFPGNADLVAPTLAGAAISTTAFTVAIWIQQDSINTGASFINLRRSSNDSGFTLENDGGGNGNLNWYVHINGPSGYQLLSVANCAANALHHVAATFDSQAGRMEIYRNGRLAASAPTQNNNPNTRHGQENLRLGRNEIIGGFVMDGMLDDVRVYDRALSAAEVAALVPPGVACVTDFNCSGSTDGVDLGVLLSSWSLPAGSSGCGGSAICPADINFDGAVNGVDLGILLNEFGPCG